MTNKKGGVQKKSGRNCRKTLLVAAATITAGWNNRAIAQSTALWLGGGDGTSWNSPANWSTYPPTGDNLYFGAGPVGTINLQGNQLANSIDFLVGFTLDPVSSTDTLTINTGSVSVGSSISASINAAISGSDGFNFAGPGTLTISGNNTYSGGTNLTGGTLIVDGPSSLATGTVSVGASSEMVMATATQFAGNITNNGTFDIPSGQTLSLSSSGSSTSFTQNSGTLAIAGTLNMTNDGFFFDNGGTITGTVNLGGANGSFLSLGAGAGNSGTFIFTGNGGTLEGASPTDIPSGVNITLQPTGSGQLGLFSGINNAGNINIVGSATSTATMNLGGTGTMTNTGILTMSATGSPSAVADFIFGNVINTTGTVNINTSTQDSGNITNNGTFDIPSGQTLSLNSSGSSTSFTQNAGALTIAGTLNMTNNSFFFDNGGTITGTVNLGGANGSFLSLGAGAGNSGTFIFTGNGGSLEGASPTDIPSGVTIILQPTGSGQLEMFSGINNAGNINIIGSAASTATMNLGAGGTMTNTGILTMSATGGPSTAADFIFGNLINTTGTVNINTSTQDSGNITNNGTFDIPSGQTLSLNSSGSSTSFTQNAGTLTIAGTLNMTNNSFFFDNGGTISGTVNLGGPNGSFLSLGAGAGNSGTFIFTGNGGTLEGGSPTDIPSGVTITLQPTGGSGQLEMFSANNAGNINIIGSATSTATMNLGAGGTMTNTGILTMSATGSPSTAADFIFGSVINTTGTVNINTSTQDSGNITNNGTFDIPSGQTLSLGSSGSSASFTQNSGTLTIAGTLNMTNDGFFFDNGGTITGTVNLGGTNGSSLSLGTGAGNSGTFIFTGNGGTLEGASPTDIPSGVTITLQPTGSGQLEAFSGVSNAGNINIIGSATSTATMNLGAGGTMTNTGILTMSATGSPSTAADFIFGNLINTTGTVNINTSTQVSGNIINNGTFDCAAGQTLSAGTSTESFTQNAGALTISGVLNMPNYNFIYDGGTIAGTLNMGSSTSTPTLSLGAGAGNSGTFIFTGRGGGLAGPSPITIPSGVTITLQPTSTLGQLRALTNVTNAGSLGIVGSATSTATLFLGGGTLTNTGTLTASATGSPSTSADFIRANLNNTTGTVNINASTQVTGNITNSGILNIASGQTLSFGSSAFTLTQTSGSINVAGGGVLALSSTSESLLLNGGQLEGSGTIVGTVAVIGGGTLQIPENSGGTTLSALQIDSSSKLDITNNRLFIDYGAGADPIASIKQWIANGFYGLPGPEIISSAITADDAISGFSYGIGYADGADGVVAGLPSGEIEIMFTLIGDANLDGTVNAEDFTPFSTNLGQNAGWDQGDFNYDGTVNAEDFTPFSHNLSQSAVLAGGLESAGGINLANVPEPISAGMMVIAGMGILRRRRRSSR